MFSGFTSRGTMFSLSGVARPANNLPHNRTESGTERERFWISGRRLVQGIFHGKVTGNSA